MAAILEHYDTHLLRQIVEDMVSKTALEKVYLYAVTRQHRCADTVFLPSAVIHESTRSYDFLVLSAEGNKRKAPELASLLENVAMKWMDTTVFVISATQFNDWLRNAHPFACKIYRQALCCYDAGTFPLTVPSVYNEEADHAQLQKVLNQHLKRAQEFMHGADLFRIRNNPPLAAFHLHQACEQLYTGIIQNLTGLRIITHNLMTLHRHCRNLITGIMDIFPMHTEPEKKLFKRLQSAYLGPRYQDNYYITAGELAVLRERVNQLSTLCQSLCPSGMSIL